MVINFWQFDGSFNVYYVSNHCRNIFLEVFQIIILISFEMLKWENSHASLLF